MIPIVELWVVLTTSVVVSELIPSAVGIVPVIYLPSAEVNLITPFAITPSMPLFFNPSRNSPIVDVLETSTVVVA